MKVKSTVRAVIAAVSIAMLAMVSGCFRYTANPSYPDGGYQYVHRDLANADKMVAAAKAAGKDIECPDEFNAIKDQMKKAYDTYKACRTVEALALAKDASEKASALCPPKPVQPAPEPAPAPAVVVPPAAKPIVLEDVHFPHDKATLTPEAIEILNRNVATLKHNPKVRVRIVGHTSLSGKSEYNDKLSERRTHAVREYLVSNGIAFDRLMEGWLGEEKPAQAEPTPDKIETDAAKFNRRVTFEIISR